MIPQDTPFDPDSSEATRLEAEPRRVETGRDPRQPEASPGPSCRLFGAILFSLRPCIHG